MSATIVWSGPDELRAFLRPLDELHPHPQNPRRGDVELVKTSLTRFGQEKPIITDRDEHDEIVAGNHTWMAARELRWTHVAALEMWADADEGLKYLLMDNRTSDNSTYDRDELLSMLDRYTAEELEATGFSDEEREQLRADLEAERQAAEEFQAELRDDEPAPGSEPAARAETVVRNVLITLAEDGRWRDFTTRLNVLRREWGITDVSVCVAETIRRETQRLRESA